MNIQFQRKVDRIIGTIICRILTLFSRKKSGAPGPVKVDKILVILLSEMGSLVLAYPMFQRLKTKYPGVKLYGLLFEKNREVLDILEVTAEQNVLTINDKSLGTFIRDSLRVIRQLRKLDVDIVIDCELFARISSIFSFISGAGIRVGFHAHTQEGLYRGNFMNRPVLYNPYRHMSQQFLTLADSIESETAPRGKTAPKTDELRAPAIEFEAEEIRAAQSRLILANEGIKDKRLVLIYPGGGMLPILAWPAEYYTEVTQQLLQKGYAVAIIGLAEDKDLAGQILSRCNDPSCIDLTGYTKTVRDLLLIFQFAALLITNDGGPGQFAALTPMPSIIFYGPETPTLYGPDDEKAFIFYEPLPCTPCLTAYNHRHSPCDGDNLCLKQIPPDRVLAKSLEILQA